MDLRLVLVVVVGTGGTVVEFRAISLAVRSGLVSGVGGTTVLGPVPLGCRILLVVVGVGGTTVLMRPFPLLGCRIVLVVVGVGGTRELRPNPLDLSIVLVVDVGVGSTLVCCLPRL